MWGATCHQRVSAVGPADWFIMVIIGLLHFATQEPVPMILSVLAAVQYWMQSSGKGVPSWSWGTWGSFSSWPVLIHCAPTVCWGCQNTLNHNFLEKGDGGRATMAGRSEIVSQIPGRKNKDNWRVQVWSLCLQLLWVLENMWSRRQDRVSHSHEDFIYTNSLSNTVW